MKALLVFTLIFALNGGYLTVAKNKVSNSFTSNNDTLVIKTEKVKGYGLFPASVYGIELLKPSVKSYFPVAYPKNIDNLRIGCELVDFKPYWYLNLKKSKSDFLKVFEKEYCPAKIDTAHLLSLKENSISILSGEISGNKIFVVDQNNNQDFSDDSVRPYNAIDLKYASKPIKCRYNIFDGQKVVKDSGWVNIGVNQSDVLSFSVAQHLESTFSIDNKKYKIGIVNGAPFYRFSFENPILAVLAEDGIKKDSLLKSEMFDLGEYLKLGNYYYRFANISNEGKYIKLVKEKNIGDKIGTQVGFLAPDFTCHTIKSDSIALKSYRGKYLLLANLTGCYSPISSYEHFKNLFNTYASKIEIIGIEYSAEDLEKNLINTDIPGKFIIAEGNRSIQNNYRKDSSSRTCFLINPKGRIVDKFDISQWKQILNKYVIP